MIWPATELNRSEEAENQVLSGNPKRYWKCLLKFLFNFLHSLAVPDYNRAAMDNDGLTRVQDSIYVLLHCEHFC